MIASDARQLYINAGFVTEDGYVKVNDKLWVKSGPYRQRTWLNIEFKFSLPTKEELNEIYLKLQELIKIQDDCDMLSLREILDNDWSWVWSSTEYDAYGAWIQRMRGGLQDEICKDSEAWVISVRRSP